ncbi:hypothetical protein GJAV_G00068340 [Gymnothorax javanicus]|nr:hypothetical protein GJAV_G00068340 [Gymnothorax javanicus]
MSVAFAAHRQRGKGDITPAAIQKLLDENNQLIQCIMDFQSKGKTAECSQYQQMLHRNLVYLATIADSNQNMQSLLPAPPTQSLPLGPGGIGQTGPPQPPHAHSMPSEGMVSGGAPAPHMQSQMNGQMPGPSHMSMQGPRALPGPQHAGQRGEFAPKQPRLHGGVQPHRAALLPGPDEHDAGPANGQLRPAAQYQHAAQPRSHDAPAGPVPAVQHPSRGQPALPRAAEPHGHDGTDPNSKDLLSSTQDRKTITANSTVTEDKEPLKGAPSTPRSRSTSSPPQPQGYPPQQQQYPGQQGYPGQQQGYGPSQGGPGQYPNYPPGQGQQYAGYRPPQPGPQQGQQQRSYGYEQGQYGNYQQ